ncbi:MAG: hypothetical protein ACI4OY_09800 [Aristaeellaceae bacterium]
MAVLLCCGADGLMAHQGTWRRLSCPLPVPSLLAAQDGLVAIADNTQRLVWLGDALLPVAGGVEALLLWQGKPLVLSGEADSLTLLSPAGSPLFLAPAGVFPQDMCLLPGGMVAVCGGAEGTVRLLRLPELTVEKIIRVPGSALRIAWQGGFLYILCAVEEEGLRCLLGRIHPCTGRYEALAVLPGLPGALLADGTTRLWIAASEALYCFRPGERSPRQRIGGFGLIRHMACREHQLLLSDPVNGTLTLLASPFHRPQVLLTGDVGQAVFL